MFDEQIVHFTELSRMSGKNRRQLQELVDVCDMIYDKNLSSLLSLEDFKSVICAFDKQGEISAFLTVEELNDCLELNELFVNYTSRKQGMAGKLLQNAKEYAKEKHLPKLELVVGINNGGARSLYEKNGFIYAKKHQNKVVMRKFVDEKVDETARELIDLSSQQHLSFEDVLEEIYARCELNDTQKELCVQEFNLLQNQDNILQSLQTMKGLV